MKLFSLPHLTGRLLRPDTLVTSTLAVAPGPSQTPTTASTLDPPVSSGSCSTTVSGSPLYWAAIQSQTHAAFAWQQSVEHHPAQHHTPQTPCDERQASPRVELLAGLKPTVSIVSTPLDLLRWRTDENHKMQPWFTGPDNSQTRQKINMTPALTVTYSSRTTPRK